MAKAEKTTVEEVREVPAVQLTLTHKEAWALATVLSKVGGDQIESPRAFTQAVSDELRRIGFDYWDSPYKDHAGASSIRFFGSAEEAHGAH